MLVGLRDETANPTYVAVDQALARLPEEVLVSSALKISLDLFGLAVNFSPKSFNTPPVLLRALALLFSTALQAEQVVCSYTYGGETRQLVALPVASPYAVKSIEVGSYFHLRVVFQQQPAALASIKVYAYADRDESLVPLHQATYPYPPPASGAARYGFTGLHQVYEPTRDGELEYWCRLNGRAYKAGRRAR
jgi:hypothetical protein